jgi:hypothetical protein
MLKSNHQPRTLKTSPNTKLAIGPNSLKQLAHQSKQTNMNVKQKSE